MLIFFCKYPQVPWILKKYVSTRITDISTDMYTGMKRIFIQRVRYKRVIIRILPASLISLTLTHSTQHTPTPVN